MSGRLAKEDRRLAVLVLDDERVDRHGDAGAPRAHEGVDDGVRDGRLHVLVDHRLHERRRREPVVEPAHEPRAELRPEPDDELTSALSPRAVAWPGTGALGRSSFAVQPSGVSVKPSTSSAVPAPATTRATAGNTRWKPGSRIHAGASTPYV